MPEVARDGLLGGDPLATLLFLASLLLAVYLLHALSALALGEAELRPAWRTAAMLLVLVTLMVGTRVRLSSRAASASKRRICR